MDRLTGFENSLLDATKNLSLPKYPRVQRFATTVQFRTTIDFWTDLQFNSPKNLKKLICTGMDALIWTTSNCRSLDKQCHTDDVCSWAYYFFVLFLSSKNVLFWCCSFLQEMVFNAKLQKSSCDPEFSRRYWFRSSQKLPVGTEFFIPTQMSRKSLHRSVS